MKTSRIIDIDLLQDQRYKSMQCRGCSDRIRIITGLPWDAIDHTAWMLEGEPHDEYLTFITRSTCMNAAAAAAAVEALCQINDKYFTWTDVFDMPFVD